MIQQNTPEWLELRRSKIGASDAATIMGVSKWRTPYDLWKEKSGLGGEQEDNPNMRRGREMEPLILKHAEEALGMTFAPTVCLSKQHPWMMASLDGLSNCGKIGLEIKCAGRKDHETASEGRVPEHYWPQVQHQLLCAELQEVIYYSFNEGDARLVRVHRDEIYLGKLLEAEQEFLRRVETFDPPELVASDYTEKTDEEWLKAAQELLSCRRDAKLLASREKQLVETLKSMADGRNCRGGGLCVYSSVVKGGIDYSAVPELRDMNFEAYRKPSSVRWTIK